MNASATVEAVEARAELSMSRWTWALALIGDRSGQANSSDLPRTLTHLVHRHAREHPHEAIRLVVLRVEPGEIQPLELVAVLVERIFFGRVQRSRFEAAEALVDVGGEAAPGVLPVVGNVDPDLDLLWTTSVMPAPMAASSASRS